MMFLTMVPQVEGSGPFIQTIFANAMEPGPRLVYADWLEENGFCEEAKFVKFGASFLGSVQ